MIDEENGIKCRRRDIGHISIPTVTCPATGCYMDTPMKAAEAGYSGGTASSGSHGELGESRSRFQHRSQIFPEIDSLLPELLLENFHVTYPLNPYVFDFGISIPIGHGVPDGTFLDRKLHERHNILARDFPNGSAQLCSSVCRKAASDF